MKNAWKISDEQLAAFLDGNADSSESLRILSAIKDSAELRDVLRLSQEIDVDINSSQFRPDFIETARVASCGDESYCSIECESFILLRHGIEACMGELIEIAVRNGWLEEEGTSPENIGRHLESRGFNVDRKKDATLSDIMDALGKGEDIIAVVDGGELLGDRNTEHLEDVFIGPIPDHSVVVTGCSDGHITIYDPDSPNTEDTYSIGRFLDAWADSCNFIVIAKYI